VPSVSSGPFYVAGYQTDAQVELRRNPHYFGRKPALERVFIKILTPEVAIAQLERGELQIIPGEISGELPPPEVARLRRNSAIQVTSYPNNNTEVIYPNLKNRPLDDVRIRQAMMYALDRESIVGTALLGMGKVAYSPVPAFAPYYNKDINTYRHNPDRARQLLREAGYAGQRIRFIIPTGDTTRQTVGTIAHQLWTAVGLNVVIEQMDFPTAVGRLLRTRDYDLAIVQNRGFNNPDLSRRFHTSGIATGVNAGQYANPEMDRLLEQARTTVDFKDQKPLLFKVQELAMRDLPVFLLYYRDSIGAVNTQQLGGAVPRFGGVHKDMANWYRK
jgi:peptide/nickel transport system substrate-binding protein